MLSIRLSKDIEKRLDLLSRQMGVSREELVCKAILEHIDNLEDTYLTLTRLKNPGKRWTLEDLENKLDLYG